MCFGKTFHLILIHFIHKIQCFKEFIHKICWVFKTMIFPKFQLIQSIFPSIEITLKIFSEPLFISINRNWFSINRKLWISFFFFFFFNRILTYSTQLFQKFSKFSLYLFPTQTSSIINFFVVFDQIFCKVFLSQGRYVHFTLSFSFFFSLSCIFSCIEGLFLDLAYLGFLMIQTLFYEIDHWVFVLGCYKHDPYDLIWSILWFLRNWKF